MRKTAFAAAGLFAIAGCTAADSPAVMAQPAHAATSLPAAAQSVEPAAEIVAKLPLQPGYYVRTDDGDECGTASRATILLFHGNGFSLNCEFKQVEKMGATNYRVTEECSDNGEAWGREEQKETNIDIYEILSPTHFHAKRQTGDWERSAHRCPLRELPEDWRDSDLDYVK